VNNTNRESNSIPEIANFSQLFTNIYEYVRLFRNSRPKICTIITFWRLAFQGPKIQLQVTGDGMKRTNPMVRADLGKVSNEDSTRRK
jgi:hypothetical protein